MKSLASNAKQEIRVHAGEKMARTNVEFGGWSMFFERAAI